MERKTILAIGLMLMVAILPSILFPPERPDPATLADSFQAVTGLDQGEVPAPELTPVIAPAAPAVAVGSLGVDPSAAETTSRPREDVVVTSPLYRFTFSSRGARLIGAELASYRSFAVGQGGRANLVPVESTFLEYSMVFGSDTLDLADWDFSPSRDNLSVESDGSRLSWVASRGAVRITIDYTFYPDRYVFDIDGRIEGVGSGAGFLLIGMGPHLGRTEKDSVGDARSYAFSTRARSIDKLKYSSLDSGEVKALSGPFEWVAIKSKYFLSALLTVEEGQPRIGGAIAIGGPREGRLALNMDIVASLPAPSGAFSLSVFVGPQEFRRLAAIGHDFEDVNPYGSFLGPVVSPFAKIVVRILIWMHENLSLAYGWVLVLFGLAVRVLLWPLNQKAMRSSMAMQAIQPDLKSLQQKHKSDPQKMQQESMKLYKEHGVNPLGGCLPSLLPMPVLFALFFVFQNTIELRGVPFFWLTDLSGPDPLYITPVLMAVSMFGLFKIGQIGVPPNPQTKMMLYVMPTMFLFFGLKFPAGLNLYYLVSNLASLPQQWLIARERLTKAAATPAST